MTTLRKLTLCAALISTLALVGCGAPQTLKQQGPETGSLESARDELKTLEELINKNSGYREEFGVESSEGRAPEGGAGAGAEETTSCEQVCKAAEAICDSAQRICAIANRFPNEPDFRERCTWAFAECARAKTECSDCQ